MMGRKIGREGQAETSGLFCWRAWPLNRRCTVREQGRQAGTGKKRCQTISRQANRRKKRGGQLLPGLALTLQMGWGLGRNLNRWFVQFERGEFGIIFTQVPIW
jgi:hypothetical protein